MMSRSHQKSSKCWWQPRNQKPPQITSRQDPAPEEKQTLVAGTVTSVGTTASTNTSPAMGHVMKMMDTIDTNAGASVFGRAGPVSVEQSHLPGTVSSTAVFHQRIAAPMVGLMGMETPGGQCVPLDRQSAQQSSVMEPVLTMMTLHQQPVKMVSSTTVLATTRSKLTLLAT